VRRFFVCLTLDLVALESHAVDAFLECRQTPGHAFEFPPLPDDNLIQLIDHVVLKLKPRLQFDYFFLLLVHVTR
jgi:hypothetical protein